MTRARAPSRTEPASWTWAPSRTEAPSWVRSASPRGGRAAAECRPSHRLEATDPLGNGRVRVEQPVQGTRRVLEGVRDIERCGRLVRDLEGFRVRGDLAQRIREA